MIISAIAAVSKDGAIGRNGTLPWRLPSDLARFKQITSGHHVIVGRKSYEDIGRPLPGRINCIITGSDYIADGCLVFNGIDAAIRKAELDGDTECFIIGGASIYRQSLPLCSKLYLTQVDAVIPDADAFFPVFDHSEWNIVESIDMPADNSNQFNTRFTIYNR